MSLLRFAQAHDVINAHVDWVGSMAMWGTEKGGVEVGFTVTLLSQVVAPNGVLSPTLRDTPTPALRNVLIF